jgi:hypothetical protein
VSSDSSEKPELIVVQSNEDGEAAEQRSTVQEPTKVMRIGTMIKQLLEEVREASLDERSRARLRDIYQQSINELADGLSPDLRDELDRLTSPFVEDEVPSESELRIAQAQLVGWLEGLFHGIQVTLFTQQAAARAQLEEMRRKGLPSPNGPNMRAATPEVDAEGRPGTYL